MRCPAGHPVDDTTRYCPTCGTPVRCSHGHPLPAGAAFCPECGTPTVTTAPDGPSDVTPAVAPRPDPHVPQDATTPTSVTVVAPVRRRRRARVALMVIGGVVAFGVILGGIGAFVHRDDTDDGPSDRAANNYGQGGDDDVPVPSAYDLCVDEFITVTGYLLDNRFSEPAFDEVLYEYGSQSQEFDVIGAWIGELAPLQAQQGEDAADQRSWELVGDYCDSVT